VIVIPTCTDIAQLIARLADDDASLAADVRAPLDAHLASCESCRAALETQRNVSAVLRMRPVDRVSPGFAARLAERLDEASGWFGIADWRAWTLRLAPVAAALALATYLGLGGSTSPTTTLEEWTLGVTDSSPASLLLQSDVSAESVMESMITGELPATREGAGNVR
jgi:hypothetical protein